MSQVPFPAFIRAGDKVALALSYDGSSFCGWQSQRKPQVPTVQESLERALGIVANTPVRVQCAGRTDTGVHAAHQVVSFQSPVDRPEKAWVRGVNTHLPDTISVHWAKPVAGDFDARFSATARRYRYVIYNAPARSALLASGVTVVHETLDAERMQRAAQCMIGELDFSSFRAVACQSNTPMRNVHFLRVTRLDKLVVIDIQANAFLYHMVRNIAGALIAVGAGRRAEPWLQQVLAARDRTLSEPTAKPSGLYLVDVSYPEQFGLPAVSPGPYFLAGLNQLVDALPGV